jgi:hypothetical protein
MDMAVDLGVPRKDVEPFFRAAVNWPHLINSIIHKKRFAPQAAVREFFPTFSYFWRYPIFWLTALPLCLTPSFMIKGMRNLYRFQRKLGGLQWRM